MTSTKQVHRGGRPFHILMTQQILNDFFKSVLLALVIKTGLDRLTKNQLKTMMLCFLLSESKSC